MSERNDPAGDVIEISTDSLRAWTRMLDRLVEKIERNDELGRELVEQRALNLDLQRQIHRLESQLRALRDQTATVPAEQVRAGKSLFGKLFGQDGR